MRDKYMDDEGNDHIICPLVEEYIKDIDCIENRDVVKGLMIETSLPEKYKIKKNWRSICENCKWHNY